nr:hypothetical protein [Tanacetum cinerariifolium]
MSILVISIVSDSSDESMGLSPSQIILFGTILAEISTETPTIPHVVPTLPHTLPFLCIDSSNTSRRAISLGRPYRTQPNRVRKMLTVRKRVQALLVGHLASRYPLDHPSSDHFSLDDSSPNSSSNSSSNNSLDSSSIHSLPDSSFDAPATICTGSSRKRCRSHADIDASTATIKIATVLEDGIEMLELSLVLGLRERMRSRRPSLEIESSTPLHQDFRPALGETSNGNGLGGVNGNPNVNIRGLMPVAHECTYRDFLKCLSLICNGTEGVVGLTRWFEKIEIVFHISNYPYKYQKSLLKLMTEVYCPRNKIQKIEIELWNLAVKGNDL